MYLTPKPHRRKKIKSPYESDWWLLSYDHAYQLMMAAKLAASHMLIVTCTGLGLASFENQMCVTF